MAVEICEELLMGGDLDDEKIKILKVDQYYSSRNFPIPPKSIDCLIVIKCKSGTYDLTLAELRDVGSTKGVRIADITSKFETTFSQFMQEDFPEIFSNPSYSITSIRAWLVTDPFNASHLSEEAYRKKIRGTVLDFFQSARPFRIGNHSVLIQPIRPNPIICTCS